VRWLIATVGLLLFWLPARLLRGWLFWRRTGHRTVLKLRLSGVLEEEEGQVRRVGRSGPRGRTLLEILDLVRLARRDPSVEALALRIGRLDAGWADLEELRQAVLRFRETGRRAFVYLESPGHAEYFLASAFEQVVAPPMATLELVGLRSEISFYKGTLDLLGVTACFEAEGEYKSFAEPFLREGMSEAFRESLDFVLSELHARFRAAVASGRGLDEDRVQELLDGGPWGARESKGVGLLDRTLYPDRWPRAIERVLEDRQPEPDDADDDPREPGRSRRGPFPARGTVRFRKIESYLRPWRWLRRLERWSAPRLRVGVLLAAGAIGSSDESEGPPGRIAWRAMTRCIRELASDDRVRAVVLRVDSPGGSAPASDLLWRELRRLAKRKPLVVSMGSMAASGGYYLAMTGDAIVASPLTITGSIGVVAGKLDLGGLLKKAGIRREVLSYGSNTGLYSSSVGLTEDERTRLKDELRVVYEEFVRKAALGRGVEYDELEQHARGRIWTGAQAVELGMADQTGTLDDAVEEAARRAGLDRPWETRLYIPPRPGVIARLQGLVPISRSPEVRLVELLTEVAGWEADQDLVQARLPFDLRVR
jgi:protease IV